jgi:hypothetical protein
MYFKATALSHISACKNEANNEEILTGTENFPVKVYKR